MSNDIRFCKPASVRNDLLPKKLYIYCSKYNIPKITDCLNGKIHLSVSTKFNDPFDSMFEYTFSVDWIKSPPMQTYNFITSWLKSINTYNSIEELEKIELLDKNIIENTEQKSATIRDIIDIVNSNLPKRDGYQVDKEKVIKVIQDEIKVKNPNLYMPVKIGCFSETFDSVLMWAYYGNNEGICIEYDLSLLDDNNPMHRILKENIYRVDYSDTRPTDNYSSISDSYFHKSSEWKHEKEWRIVSISMDDYIDMPCVSAVYLGAYFSKNEPKERQVIIEQIKKNTPVYKMAPDQKKYKLIAEQYDWDSIIRIELNGKI